jgi:2-dehydro-3-deoxyphosphooctonate aldolase (KDO 8-P synthase)
VAKSGVSVGADGVFLEIHDNPTQALSDKHNSLNLKELQELLRSLLQFAKARDGNESFL